MPPLPSLDMSWPAAALAVLALLAGGFARGYSGFGLTALIVPVLSFAMPTAEIIPVCLALEIVASAGQARTALPNTDWRRIAWLMAGSTPGIPLGVAALAVVDPAVMRPVALGCLLAATLALMLGLRVGPRSAGPFGTVAAGLLVGIVTGLAGIGGLFLITYLAALSLSPERLRGTSISYFFVLDMLAVAACWKAGLFGGTELLRMLAAIPLMAAGIVLGSRHFLGASPEGFRRSILAFLTILSAGGLLKALLEAL